MSESPAQAAAQRLVPLVERAALGATMLLGGAPLLGLLLQAAFGSSSAHVFEGGRAWGLLLRSAGIAAGVTGFAVTFGGVLGVALARVRIAAGRALTVGLVAAFCVSPYLLALGWLGGRLDGPFARIALGHAWAVALVLGAGLTPLAAVVVRLLVLGLPILPEESAFLHASLGDALRRVVLHRLQPALAVTALLLFGLALSDYAVGSLLQVPTYPIEIFLFYAAKFDGVAAARACLPLLVLGAMLASAVVLLVPRIWTRRTGGPRSSRWPLTPRAHAAIAGITWGLAMGVLVPAPFGWLRGLPPGGMSRHVLASGLGAAGNSLVIALLASLVVLLLAVPASAALRGPSRPAAALVGIVLLLPVFVPSSAFGIAWVPLAAWLGAVPARVGLLGPALCLAARFAGMATLGLAGARHAMQAAEPIEAAVLFESSASRRWIRIELPALAPAIGAVAAVCFALSLNDTGVLVLTVPPGSEVLPLRVDNLLHYGEPAQAVALAVFTAVVAALPAAVGVAWSEGARA